MSRFGGIDNIFTASTNQREIINRDGGAQVQAAPIAASPSGSVSRSSLAPASSGSMAPASSLAPVASSTPLAPAMNTAAAPVERAQQRVASAATAAVPAPVASREASDPAGWSRAGGTAVTVKNGETVYNLSRRFGVPANVIMQVNGLSESRGLQTGDTVIIPTYVYAKGAPVSAPDNNPKVAAAKSSRGEKQPSDGTQPLGQQVAALPETSKPKPVPSAGGQVAGGGTYVVKEGDTLNRIASRTGVSAEAIKKANGMPDGLVRIGQTLKLPSGAAPGTTVASAPAKAAPVVQTVATSPVKETSKPTQNASYTPPKKNLAQVEQDDTPAPNATGIDKMRWPVRGRVISGFGKGGGKSNDGVDIAVPEGTSVKAAENGVVIYAGDGLKEFGNTVLVRHEDGLVTVYGHASQLKVTRGQQVKRGQEIALSGMTGSTDAPKLHFEVRKNSAPVNPSTYLE